MYKLTLSVFLIIYSAHAHCINLIINGKTYYIREYQISSDGKEIRINHTIDLETGSCDKESQRRAVARQPAQENPSHRNPNRRLAPFERIMLELNNLGNKGKEKRRRHQ
jgi:hypothetical protein